MKRQVKIVICVISVIIAISVFGVIIAELLFIMSPGTPGSDDGLFPIWILYSGWWVVLIPILTRKQEEHDEDRET